jgi:membrane-bound lytic murein transglycosylase D
LQFQELEGPVDPVQNEAAPKAIQVEVQDGDGDHQPVPEVATESSLPDAPRTPAPVETGDLWGRIARGFAVADHEHPRALRERTWLVKRPGYLNRVVDRARPYLHLIVEAVEARGMPSEIALLPIVESAFQPFAYSPGRAAGLWQFIPSTGRNYGLKQTWWYDGRRDVLAATEAALDYLQKLNADFDGDWLLSLAAYNAGEGTVMRAIKRNQHAGKPTDYWSLNLPKETMGYVPKLLAVSDVFTRPEAFGLQLDSIDDATVLAEVATGGQIDLARAAELADLSIEELHRYNPGFNRWATDPSGPHRLLVPIDRADAFEDRLAALGDREQLMQWRRHRIQQGESLIAIALKYGTTPDVLRSVNQIRGDLIQAGGHLFIPVPDSDGRIPENAEQFVASLAGQTLPPAKRKVVHTIAAGDSLWKVSRRYGVSVQQLAAWNGGNEKATLHIGQQLSVWLPNEETTRIAGIPPARQPELTQQIRYTVRRGDSLYLISQRFNVTIDELRTWNSLQEGSHLQPGQRLVVHVDIARVTRPG